ncbi:syncytin-B-like [Chiloscyllium plagiosum]|uniref:syncytin-B-like n=1 Tax=Chiloscyllium plagiosum TaxID=36176 RepID=UPI001CB7D2E2|nr:syncytin-B-like [Chiloscyllium plagiosum]
MYGTARAGIEIQKLAASLEELANKTADVLAETQSQVAAITTEMISTRLTTLQNRMALDYRLAEKGGTCALIGEECCTYIPEVSSNITEISKHVRDKIAKIREAGNRYPNDKRMGMGELGIDWLGKVVGHSSYLWIIDISGSGGRVQCPKMGTQIHHQMLLQSAGDMQQRESQRMLLEFEGQTT